MKSNKTLITIAIIAGIIILLGIPTCSSYNGMVGLKNEAEQKWASVENEYQRRGDLIPNLVATVKGYATHESTTLQGVTNARAGIAPVDTTGVMNAARQAMNAPDANAYATALRDLQSQFSIYVNAVHEAYPDLKANENFMALQDELAGTENRVEKARLDYTKAVKDYNNKVQKFPGSIVAGIFGFESMQQFQAEPGAERAPKVTFD